MAVSNLVEQVYAALFKSRTHGYRTSVGDFNTLHELNEPPQCQIELRSVAMGKRVGHFKQSARRVVWQGAKTLLAGDEDGVRRFRLLLS